MPRGNEVRSVAAALVVFAGAFLYAVTALAEAVSRRAPGGGLTGAAELGYAGGAVLGAYGVYLLLLSWRPDRGPRPRPEEPRAAADRPPGPGVPPAAGKFFAEGGREGPPPGAPR